MPPWFHGLLRWLIWLGYVGAWTRALLVDNPINPGNDLVLQQQLFLFSKAVHVSAYAVFAGLSGWVPIAPRYRWLLFVFMSAHSLATEYFQQFFPTRHPSWRDVGLDHLGILLGILATWRWWRGRPQPAASPSATVPS